MNPEDVANLIAKAQLLLRGCDCDYDYRCGKCQRILDVVALADKIADQLQGAS